MATPNLKFGKCFVSLLDLLMINYLEDDLQELLLFYTSSLQL